MLPGGRFVHSTEWWASSPSREPDGLPSPANTAEPPVVGSDTWVRLTHRSAVVVSRSHSKERPASLRDSVMEPAPQPTAHCATRPSAPTQAAAGLS